MKLVHLRIRLPVFQPSREVHCNFGLLHVYDQETPSDWLFHSMASIAVNINHDRLRVNVWGKL